MAPQHLRTLQLAREHRLQGDREPDDHQVRCHSYPSEPARSERRGLPCRHVPVPLRPLLIASGVPNLVTSGPYANSHRLMRRTHRMRICRSVLRLPDPACRMAGPGLCAQWRLAGYRWRGADVTQIPWKRV